MTHYCDVNGVRLRYDRREGSGVPLVLMHEMGGALESWDLVRERVGNRASLAFDQRGFGLSEKPAGTVRMADLVEDVVALMDRLGVDEVHLVGGAVGGGVALAAAAALGSRAVSVTCLAPATGVPDDRKCAVRSLADALERNGIRNFFETDTVPKAWPGDRFDRIGPGFAIFLSTQLSTAPASLAAAYRMLAELDMTESLPMIRCPVTMLAGTYDGARPPASVRAAAAALPSARVLEVASGHFMALQNPELVSELLV